MKTRRQLLIDATRATELGWTAALPNAGPEFAVWRDEEARSVARIAELRALLAAEMANLREVRHAAEYATERGWSDEAVATAKAVAL